MKNGGAEGAENLTLDGLSEANECEFVVVIPGVDGYCNGENRLMHFSEW